MDTVYLAQKCIGIMFGEPVWQTLGVFRNMADGMAFANDRIAEYTNTKSRSVVWLSGDQIDFVRFGDWLIASWGVA